MEACVILGGLLRFHVGDMSCSCFFFFFFSFSPSPPPKVVPKVYSIHKYEGLCYLRMGDIRGIPK